MANDIYFRTSLSGYNKNDVIRFIEKLNSEQVERVNELNDRIRISQTEAKKMSVELDAMKKKCAQLESQLSMSDENRAINDEKAQKYDAMQGTYADIMLDAEHISKEKVKLAEEKAEKILAEATEIKKRIVDENKRILENSKNEFLAVVERLTASLDESIAKTGIGEGNE